MKLYLDTEPGDADWSKKTYDLLGVNTLDDLEGYLGHRKESRKFKQWLQSANNYPWVDNAPTEIRLAIRAHKDYI
jgi:hypothetical protein